MTMFPFRILQEHAPKAKYKEPCNGCGLCCRVEPCEVSKNLLHSHQAPCIALEFHDGKFLCGVVLHPDKYLQNTVYREFEVRAYIEHWIAPGQGCDMPDGVVAIKLG